MARVVIQAAATVGTGNFAKMYHKGEVCELSAAEQTALTGAGGAFRAASPHSPGASSPGRDQMGESFAASNSTP